jgi:hypothetical protein
MIFLGPRANAELVPKFHIALQAFPVALTTLISKLIPIIRSKIPAQLLSSAHNKVHSLQLYLFAS